MVWLPMMMMLKEYQFYDPQCNCQEQLRESQSSVNLQIDDGHHGMSHYQQIVQYISQQLQMA